MLLKAFNITLGILVAFTVWCAALVLAVLALHVLVVGGFVAYHLMHS